MAMSDRIAVLNQGKIAQLGSPNDIYDAPQSEFVANFIGRTNLLRGRLAGAVEAGNIGLVESAIGPMMCRFIGGSAAGQDVSFVIRPENIELEPLYDNVEKAPENTACGRITARVYLGEIAEYTVDLDGRFQLLVRAKPDLAFGSNERVRVRLPAERTIAISQGLG
jgi:ABC-type Fe3+/spermidine/putrescine transport system ATPase subunit